ncbi:reprolysin-like metallopeptidase [sulfur-oxidizing endosymbiont of Gigantopelta aegis]|uniref:reprolysin-like metallopeptidase n=1 Tax=sulfur-oxidizing endosymbiont of Gigantopelta aegis TaxID=2794934 RepID=UPI0018DCEF94|nr:M12 family metallo-peptidase [sulfur-oxidizing endosymbiont of Gigantopelta aegis]
MDKLFTVSAKQSINSAKFSSFQRNLNNRLGKSSIPKGIAISLSKKLLALKPGDELSIASLTSKRYIIVFDELKNNKQHRKGHSMTWIGHLKGLGTQYRAHLSLNNKIIMGRISTPDGILQLKTINGQLRLIDFNLENFQHAQFATENDSIIPPTISPAPQTAQATNSQGSQTVQTAAAPTSINGNTIVDVLVLYNGSFASENAGAISTRLDHLVSIANQAYSDSQVAMQIRLVGTQQITYNNNIDNNNALDDLTNNTIPGTDIFALRNQLGADLVILVRPYSNTNHTNCGIAWINSSLDADYAYATVGDGNDIGGSNYYCDDISFTHELGHIMGISHDIASSGGLTGSHPYSHGYGISGRFGTIMGNFYPGLYFFSNPNISNCDNSPCGTIDYDAARSLNTDKDLLSNFRNDVATINYTLNTTLTGSGAINSDIIGINCGADCSEVYIQNTDVVLTAIAATGFVFSAWNNCPAIVNNTCAISMTSDLTVTAVFIPQYTVTATSSAGGGISPTYQLVNAGNTASFTVINESSYTTDSSVGGTCAPGSWNNDIYTISSINADCSVSFSFSTISIASAIDYPGLSWTSSGDALWRTQSSEFNIGQSALQSGVLANNQQSIIQTRLSGPKVVNFYWKVSSQFNADFVKFYIDNVEIEALSGEVDWVKKSMTLSAGSHELKWIYSKDAAFNNGLDAAWVDGIETFNTSYFISASANNGGTISNSQTVDYNNKAQFIISPNEGYSINRVSGTCGGSLSVNTFTTANINSACTVVADFYNYRRKSNVLLIITGQLK